MQVKGEMSAQNKNQQTTTAATMVAMNFVGGLAEQGGQGKKKKLNECVCLTLRNWREKIKMMSEEREMKRRQKRGGRREKEDRNWLDRF